MSAQFDENYQLILNELRVSLTAIDSPKVVELLAAITRSRRIFVVGAGRMGILLSTFAMRLNHLGFTSHVVGSVTCPPISSEDILLVASSSGETATVREVVIKAAREKATVAAVTAVPNSTIGRLASQNVFLRAPSSLNSSENETRMSKQPMKTLFEQTLFVLLECIVLMLLDQTGQTAVDMSRRHGNLE